MKREIRSLIDALEVQNFVMNWKVFFLVFFCKKTLKKNTFQFIRLIFDFVFNRPNICFQYHPSEKRKVFCNVPNIGYLCNAPRQENLGWFQFETTVLVQTDFSLFFLNLNLLKMKSIKFSFFDFLSDSCFKLSRKFERLSHYFDGRANKHFVEESA